MQKAVKSGPSTQRTKIVGQQPFSRKERHFVITDSSCPVRHCLVPAERGRCVNATQPQAAGSASARMPRLLHRYKGFVSQLKMMATKEPIQCLRRVNVDLLAQFVPEVGVVRFRS